MDDFELWIAREGIKCTETLYTDPETSSCIATHWSDSYAEDLQSFNHTVAQGSYEELSREQCWDIVFYGNLKTQADQGPLILLARRIPDSSPHLYYIPVCASCGR